MNRMCVVRDCISKMTYPMQAHNFGSRVMLDTGFMRYGTFNCESNFMGAVSCNGSVDHVEPLL